MSTDSWKVDVTVDDAQIGLIAVGDQAQLTTTSSTDPLFGTISSIGLISTASGETASYPVVVTLTGTPTGLHDGTSATVTLIYEQLTDVLTVPTAAIHTVDGQSVVDKVSGDQQVSTPVGVGESDGTNTQITSGLAEGDEVAVTITTPAAEPAAPGPERQRSHRHRHRRFRWRRRRIHSGWRRRVHRRRSGRVRAAAAGAPPAPRRVAEMPSDILTWGAPPVPEPIGRHQRPTRPPLDADYIGCP